MLKHKNRNMSVSRGFTLIELLVVIAIISLLVSILLPSLQKARELAKSVSCACVMKGYGLAFQYYFSDYEGCYPAYYGWNGPYYNFIAPYMEPNMEYRPASNARTCPSLETEPDWWWSGYGINYQLSWTDYMPIDEIGQPSEVVNLVEISRFLNWDWSHWEIHVGGGETQTRIDSLPLYLRQEHVGDSNYLYLDSHIETNVHVLDTVIPQDKWVLN